MGFFEDSKLKKQMADNEISVAKFIPYSHHVNRNLVSTLNGDYLAVIKLTGRSHYSANDDELDRWVADLNNHLKGQTNEHVCFWSHIVRHKVDEYKRAVYDNQFCRDLDNKYQAAFSENNLMVNDLYLTVIYRPVVDSVLKVLDNRQKMPVNERILQQKAAVDAIEGICDSMMLVLKPYKVQRLGAYEHNSRMFCSILEFFSFLIDGEHKRIPITRERYNRYLSPNRLIFSRNSELGEVRTIEKSKFFAMAEIKEYDDITVPGHLNNFLSLDCEFVLSQSFSILSLQQSKAFMLKQKKHLLEAKDLATSQVQQIDLALDQLISGVFTMGNHHAVIKVWGDTVRDARQNLKSATVTISEYGINMLPSDLSLEAAFWSQLPANWKWIPRPAPITSQNWWCFSSLHNFHSGKPTGNPWGDAVTLFKTVTNTPLYFNLHVSREDADDEGNRLLGNTIIFGQSGAGKTVLLNFILAQAQKFKPRLCVFDKDRGMEIFIRAIGGSYQPLQIGVPSGFNPLQMPFTPENVSFLKMLFKELITSGGYPATFQDEKEIEAALNVIAEMPPESRNISIMLQSLPNVLAGTSGENDHPSVYQRLLKWSRQGTNGWVFDNPTDSLKLDTHRSYGFDITEFIEIPEIRSAVMMYLIYRTEEMIDGTPFIYAFDEFWKMLTDSYFQHLVRNKLKTIRKQNGLLIFATQEPHDALSSDISKTIISQCATQILLQNSKAEYSDYVEGLRLTEREYEIVRDIPEGSRLFMTKQDNLTAMCQLNLYGFERELSVLSGTPDSAERVEALVSEYGDNPEIWLPIFYQQNGFTDAVAE